MADEGAGKRYDWPDDRFSSPNRALIQDPFSPPFVSVVIPTRDRPELLDTALTSVCDQSYPPDRFEVIVCEDGPASSSKAVVDRVASERGSGSGPRIRWMRASGSGVNSARNSAISEASGDPIVLTDDDVIAPSEWLQELVEGFLRHPNAGCAGGPVRIRYEGRRPRLCPDHSIGAGEVELDVDEGPIDIARLIGANLALRRRAIEEAGDFDEFLIAGSGADWQWQSRYLDTGGEIVYLPQARLLHRRTPAMTGFFRYLDRRFRRGFNDVIRRRERGLAGSGRQDLRRALLFLGHAIRRRCEGGLFQTAFSLGSAVGQLFDRLGWHRGISRIPKGTDE